MAEKEARGKVYSLLSEFGKKANITFMENSYSDESIKYVFEHIATEKPASTADYFSIYSFLLREITAWFTTERQNKINDFMRNGPKPGSYLFYKPFNEFMNKLFMEYHKKINDKAFERKNVEEVWKLDTYGAHRMEAIVAQTDDAQTDDVQNQ
jgi:hypothetical protein